MITPSFGLTATERVLPKLALDFTTASLDPRVTFTRTGNTATVTNSSGYVVPINADLPRFDFNPVTLACKGLLIEEARTNICLQSADFATTWTTNNATPTAASGISPDGTNNAYGIFETVTNGTHYITQTVTTTLNATITLSIYLKQNGRTWALLQMVGTAVFPSVNINLATGALGTINGTATATVSDAGNGWWRLTLTAVTDRTDPRFRFYTETGDNQSSYAGDVTKGILAYGAQLEVGAFATSYIPTTTTALTRNADVATMTGTNFSDWYNQSQGSFAVKASFKSVTGSGNGICSINIGSFTDSIYISRNVVGFGNATVDYIVRVGGAITQSDYITNIVTSTDTPYQICVAYENSNFAISSQGANTKTKATGAIPTVDQLYFGRTVSTFNFLNGWIQEVNYWPQRLVNPEVQAFSKQG